MSKKLIDKLQDIDVATALDGDRLCMDTYTAKEVIAICQKETLEKIVKWALNQGFSTGHADNIDSLLDEISLDIAELRRNILEIF